jgi:hypothetical protein
VTGPFRPLHSQRSRAPQSESAVTPVIGAILILAITILGIAGVLVWGAPMIDRIQARNAQVGVVGEFQDLRDASSVLSVPDHSRFPTLVIPRGELSLQEGTRIMVTSDRDYHATLTDYPACDFRITNLEQPVALPATWTIGWSAVGCRPGATVEVYSVSGSTVVSTGATQDFSQGDWLFRLAHASCIDGGVCAEAWLHSGDQVSWAFESATGLRTVTYESGAIFSLTDGTLFLEREPNLGDTVFGSNYFGLWLRSLTAADYSSISGAGSHQVYLSLLGNYDRVESSTVTRLRFDFVGDMAESWCNALLARDISLASASYQSQVTDCGVIPSAQTQRSVCYSLVTDPCTSSPTSAFTFRFLHARIYTSLSI